MARWAILMEASGATRDAMTAAGHTAISVDFRPAQTPGEHHQGDVFAFMDRYWRDFDAFLAHPTCTYLTGSASWAYKDPDFDRYPGVGYHQKLKPGTLFGAERRAARIEALNDVRRLMSYDLPHVIENPVGKIGTEIRPATQFVQPFQFGADASKATGLWMHRLPPIVADPADYVKPRMVCRECGGHNVYGSKGCNHCGAEEGLLAPRWANQTDSGQNALSPSSDRAMDRSDTYPGIAKAIAVQLGHVPVERNLL